MKRRACVLACLVWCIISIQIGSGNLSAQTEPLRIERITPANTEVPLGREIVITFNQPMVALGRMERTAEEVPVTISPKLNCQWRWLNTSSLACHLSEGDQFRGATTYTLSIQDGFVDRSGQPLGAVPEHQFSTVTPRIEYNDFERWHSAVFPSYFIRSNLAVSADQMRRHLFFLVEPTGERVSVDVEEVQNREETWKRVTPERDLPPDVAVSLRIEPGLRSEQGPLLGTQSEALVEFKTFPPFRFLGVRCTEGEDDTIFYPVGGSAPDQGCDPTSWISLVFSAPVVVDGVRQGLTFSPSPVIASESFSLWDLVYGYSSIESSYYEGRDYTLSLPSPLRAQTEYTLTGSADSMRDEFGRSLAEGFTFTFKTRDRPENLVLGNRISVLEKEVDSHLAVFPTNLQGLTVLYSALTNAGKQSGLSANFPLSDFKNLAYRFPLKVRDLLKGHSGVVEGTVSGGSLKPRWFLSQVTPYQVHLKLGHFNSLAWVSNFSDGKPVEEARVAFHSGTLKPFNVGIQRDRLGTTDARGIALLPGLESVDPTLSLVNQWDEGKERLFLKVTRGDELAIVPVTYDLHTYASGVYPNLNRKHGHVKSWGTTAQGVYRLGDTVQYKIYVRAQDVKGFKPAERSAYTVQIRDPMDRLLAERKNLTLSEFGALDGSFEVPPSGAVGTYRIVLTASYTKESWYPVTVLVSDFTPAPFKVEARTKETFAESGEKVHLSTEAKLHAGGPWAEATSRVTALLTARSFSPQKQEFASFQFGTSNDGEYFEPDSEEILSEERALDKNGELKSEIPLPEGKIVYGELTLESAVQDDRGKFVTDRVSLPYFGRDRLIGLSQADWVLKSNVEAQVKVIVLSPEEVPQSNVPYVVYFEHEETRAARVKGPGNAYTTQYESVWVTDAECRGSSQVEPQLCTVLPKLPGPVRFRARVEDSSGKIHETVTERWVVGNGQVVWGDDNDTTLEVSADKQTYSLGETAKFLVKNPYPNAEGLLTIERYGVLKSWTRQFGSNSEIIEVPITEELVPGFYLGVTLFSPRVDKPINEVQVDLGKPAFRMGYSAVEVSDSAKKIEISVRSEREEYRPREQVTLHLEAKPTQGKLTPLEFAVVVLDQGVFDLIRGGSAYFNPLRGFFGLESLDVQNYSLLLQLIGRQKFEKKGANQGGDGGKVIDIRSIKTFVSYWNPSLKADAHGKASIQFQAPDNLTGWKVLALAVTKNDQMGLGEGLFRVNQPLELRTALPNQVRSGDVFTARFTIMNRTDAEQRVLTKITAQGAVEEAGGVERVLTLKPFERQLITEDVRSRGEGAIRFVVRSEAGTFTDALEVVVPVQQALEKQVASVSTRIDQSEWKEEVEIPTEALPDLSTVGVVLSPSLIGDLTGAFAYMRDYPYSCWEQKMSKALGAALYLKFKPYIPAGFVWDGAHELVNQTLKDAPNFQLSNGAMVFYQPREEYANPFLSVFTAFGFVELKRLGFEIPQDVEKKLVGYLQGILKQDNFPEYYSARDRSIIRASVLNTLAARKLIGLSDIKRVEKELPILDLFAKAHVIGALASTAPTDGLAKSVLSSVMNASHESDSKVKFSENEWGAFHTTLSSSSRSHCAVLSALTMLPGNGNIAAKVARGALAERGRDGGWASTQENVYCLVALSRYVERFEEWSGPVAFTAQFAEHLLGSHEFKKKSAEPIEFDRAVQSSDIGKTQTLTVAKQSGGAVYANARVTYFREQGSQDPQSAGLDLRREYSVKRGGAWTLLNSSETIERGDLVRVDLFLSLPAARNFVVVNDQVPGGLEPVNRQLQTASIVDADQAEASIAAGSFWHERGDWQQFAASRWSFYHQELRHDSVRFYSEYLEPGNYHLSYMTQAVATGTFSAPPARAEEMYSPDVFGVSGSSTLGIQEH